MTGQNRIRRYAGTLAMLLCTAVSILPAGKAAAQSQSFLEGSGKVGSFAVDVLQDFTLGTSLDADGATSESVGKNRLKELIKGKSLNFLKGKITGGDDISLGMALILNRIFDRLNQHRRRSGGRAGMCELAAMNQAWGIAFDAKNQRLLRGSANVVFDLLTSTIPGAAGLAESLVTNIGKAALKELRAQTEKKIKEAWANAHNEAFKYEKSSGPCKLTMIVLWHKKKNKYLFLIKGTCGCKKVPINPPDDTREIPLRSFEVLGGGSITPSLDLRNPRQPKIKLRAGFPSYKVNANCACALGVIEDPPPPPEEDPRYLSEQGHIKIEASVKCDACRPKYDELNAAANSHNLIADRMNALAAKVNAQPFKTADRDRQIKLWNKLKSTLDDQAIKYDKIFIEFDNCEKTECKLSGPLDIGEIDTRRPTSTTCDKCQSIVGDINAEIEKYNAIVKEMNALVRLARAGKMQHGTVEGNATYRKWKALDAQRKVPATEIKRLHKELGKCEAKFCFRMGGFNKIPYTKTDCKRPKCIEIQKRMNAVEKHYNEIIDSIKSGFRKYQQYLVDGGSDSSKEGAAIRRKPMLEIRKLDGLWDKMHALQRELLDCQRLCRALDQESARITTGGGPLQPPGASTGGTTATPATGSEIAGKVERMVAAGTSCPRYCQGLYDGLVRLFREYQRLRGRITSMEIELGDLNARIAFEEYALYATRNPKLANRQHRFFGRRFDWKLIDSSRLAEREQFAQAHERNLRVYGPQRVAAERELQAARDKLSRYPPRLQAAYASLLRCEKRCSKVQISDTKIRIGNDPFDTTDPLREDATRTTATAGATAAPAAAAGPTIQVIPFGGTFIPIDKMFLALPDACPDFHFHEAGGPPTACDGSMPGDPDISACGFGKFSAVIDIPKASCANP